MLSMVDFKTFAPCGKNKERIKNLELYKNELNFKWIEFPIKPSDISKFEKQNPSLKGINVFSINEKNKIYPLRLNSKDCQDTIDLFLHEQDGKWHYSLIGNFGRLINSQLSKGTNSKKYICKKCLSHYTKENLMEKHIQFCQGNETQ